MNDRQQSQRWLTRKRVLWAVVIIVGIMGVCIFLQFAYVHEWKWTGLAKDPEYHKRTLWDWLNLLIVPAVLALGGYLFTRSENRRTREAAGKQRELDRQVADDQRSLDREIADERRQDDMLQAYLDGMSQLLTDKERPLHRAQSGDSLSTVARARTLTVLGRLDNSRKGSVLQFLFESGLIFQEHTIIAEIERHNIVSLDKANLSGAVLQETLLIYAYLSGADLSGANLYRNYLSGAYLSDADLSYAVLREANLSRANLREANLSRANLREAKLHAAKLHAADLSGAYLSGAYLSDADLSGADLREAYLRGANLSDTKGMSNEDLAQQAFTLKGATMPNGQKYEDWLKDREKRQQDE